MNEAGVTVIARNYDGSIRRSWKCELLRFDGELICLRGVFALEVDHPNLGKIEKGTVSYEYFWLSRWYNIFKFFNPDGSLRNWYCNITKPPRFSGLILEYIDLDLDLLVWPDRAVQVLDLDEFQENAKLNNYSPEVRQTVEICLADLNRLASSTEFPFDEA